MNLSLLKPLLISALATSMLVGCAELPTTGQNQDQNQSQTPPAEQTPITSQDVKAMLGDVKQLLIALSTLKGASQEFSAVASAYRLSGYAIAQTGSPWDWTTTTLQDGTEESTRHVIERDSEGKVITDISSTRRVKREGNDATLTQEEIVKKSPVMRLGTYMLEGTRKVTGMGTPDYKMERTQTSTFTPFEGGAPTSVTVEGTSDSSQSTLTASGMLPDGSTVRYDSSNVNNRQSSSKDDSFEHIDYGFTLTLTSPDGKTFKLGCKSDSYITQTKGKSTSEGKSTIQVALGAAMKIRFIADTLSTLTIPTSESGGSSSFTMDRFNLTAELLDGAEKRLAPIELGIKEGSYDLPKTAMITLEGEAPTPLDMTPVISLMNLEVSMLPSF